MEKFKDLLEEILQPEIWEKEWEVNRNGDITHKYNGYHIPGERLAGENWLSHMADKTWVDMNTFFPAFQEACYRRGLNNIQPF